jgi:hypothetical protein
VSIYSLISISSISGNSISLEAAIRQTTAATMQITVAIIATMSIILMMVNPPLVQFEKM